MEKYSTTRKTVPSKEKYGLTGLFNDCVLGVGILIAIPVILFSMDAMEKDKAQKIEAWNAANVPGWNRSEGQIQSSTGEPLVRSPSPAAIPERGLDHEK